MVQRTAFEGRIVRRLYYAASVTQATELLKLYQEGTLIYDIANNAVQNWHISRSLETYSYQEYVQTGTGEETQARSASGTASSENAAEIAAYNSISAAPGWDSTRDQSWITSPFYRTEEETQGRSASGTASTESQALAAAMAAISPASGWDGTRNGSGVAGGFFQEETQGRSASGTSSTQSQALADAMAAVSPASGWDGTRNGSGVASSVSVTQSQSRSASGTTQAEANSAVFGLIPDGATVTGISASYNSATMLWTSTVTFTISVVSHWRWTASWIDYRDVLQYWTWSATWTDYRSVEVAAGYTWTASWTDYRTVPVFGYVNRTGTRTTYVAQWDRVPAGTPFTQYRIERDGGSDVVITNLAATSYNFGTTNYRARIRAENPDLGIESVWSEYAQG